MGRTHSLSACFDQLFAALTVLHARYLELLSAVTRIWQVQFYLEAWFAIIARGPVTRVKDLSASLRSAATARPEGRAKGKVLIATS